jgi:hypothetical protein
VNSFPFYGACEGAPSVVAVRGAGGTRGGGIKGRSHGHLASPPHHHTCCLPSFCLPSLFIFRRFHLPPFTRCPSPFLRPLHSSTTPHCLTGQYLHWTKNLPTAKCWWCQYRTQTREHLFKCCPHWKRQQKILWAEVRSRPGEVNIGL